MLDFLVHRVLIRLSPGIVPGGTLHRRALDACVSGRYVDAEQLFEAAAAAYRHELRVEPLARLRVHQNMARARACGDPAREAAMMLDIVRGLNKLDRLESLAAPHALRDAREVLAEWLAEGATVELDLAGPATLVPAA
jgi:hypothetical protein